MIKIYAGNEPYMAEHYIKTYYDKLESPEICYRRFDAMNESVEEYMSSISFMDYKLAVVRMQNLKEVDNTVFSSIKAMETDNILLIHVDSYDKRTAFYKELLENKMLEIFDKEDAVSKLPAFLCKHAAENGAVFEDGVVDGLIRRIGYIENPAVTISTLVGYVKNMASISKTISMEVMKSIIPAYDKEERFMLAKMILNKDIASLKTQAMLLRGEEIGCLSSLLKEYRIAYKSKYFTLKDIGVGFSVLAKKEKNELAKGICILTGAISSCKNGTAPASLLMDCFMRLI